MLMENFKKQVATAKKIFTPNTELFVRIKKGAHNPFGQFMFDHYLVMQEKYQRSTYKLYIHLKHGYISFSCPSEPRMGTSRLRLDEKLWIELMCMFEPI